MTEQQAYWRGFEARCAQYGVNPGALVKAAQYSTMADNPTSRPQQLAQQGPGASPGSLLHNDPGTGLLTSGVLGGLQRQGPQAPAQPQVGNLGPQQSYTGSPVTGGIPSIAERTGYNAGATGQTPTIPDVSKGLGGMGRTPGMKGLFSPGSSSLGRLNHRP